MVYVTTVGPRVEFSTSHYPRLRVWHPEREVDVPIYLHRLTAYAHGEIDDLWSPLFVHHEDADPWNNRPENLRAVTRAEHEELEPHTANLKV